MKYTIYYCKAGKKTGKPIVVANEKNDGKIKFYNTFIRDYGRVKLKMKFKNASGKAKKAGATTVMEVEVLQTT